MNIIECLKTPKKFKLNLIRNRKQKENNLKLNLDGGLLYAIFCT